VHLQGSEELFSTEPLPARTPAAESVSQVGSTAIETVTAATASSFITRPRTPISSGLHVDNLRHMRVDRLDEDLVGGVPEVCNYCKYFEINLI